MASSEALRRFGPKPADHFSVGEACPACGKPFKAGDYTTLIAQRPPRPGEGFTVPAIEIHHACGDVVFKMVREQ